MGIFLLVPHSYRFKSTTGPPSWNQTEFEAQNSRIMITVSSHPHLFRMLDQGVRAEAELCQQAEHTRCFLSFCSVAGDQTLQQGDRHVDGG